MRRNYQDSCAIKQRAFSSVLLTVATSMSMQRTQHRVLVERSQDASVCLVTACVLSACFPVYTSHDAHKPQ